MFCPKTIVHKICRKENIQLDGVNFYEVAPCSSHLIFDFRTNVLLMVSEPNFTKKLREMEAQIFQHTIYTIYHPVS